MLSGSGPIFIPNDSDSSSSEDFETGFDFDTWPGYLIAYE